MHSPFLWVVIGINVLSLVLVSATQKLEVENGLQLVGGLVATAISVFSLTVFINYIFSRLPKLRVCLNAVLIFLYIFLQTFYISIEYHLSYDLVVFNFAGIFTAEGAQLIWGKTPIAGVLFVVFSVALIAYSHKRHGLLHQWNFPKNKLIPAAIAGGMYLGMVFTNTNHFDPITFFIQSAHRSFKVESTYYLTENRQIDFESEYPYVHTNNLSTLPLKAHYDNREKEEWPHVFIVMIESFNQSFVQTKSPEGKEYIPYFNSLISKGVYVERFYGNATQTSRGQFAILCGVIPSYLHKIFLKYHDNNFECLSDILKQNGYTNLFFKAYKSLSFDNTGQFVRKRGFDYSHGMESSFITEEDKKYIWGWGLQDDRFYIKFFDFLDQVQKDKETKGDFNKYFGALTTVSNHGWYDKVPVEQREHYPKADNTKQHYANSLYVTDKYLKTFFAELRKRDYLENSVVILVGDHGVAMGRRGSFSNEQLYHEDIFRTPFLLLWDKIQPKQIKGTASQLDIAPTVLDILGIQQEVQFMGESLFVKSDSHFTPIYHIQPYDGRYWVYIEWPLKYVVHFHTQKRLAFNLEQDPHEEHNIHETLSQETIDKMEEGINVILMNQKLIEENRIHRKKDEIASATNNQSSGNKGGRE